MPAARRSVWIPALALLALGAPLPAAAQQEEDARADVEIPYQRFVLDNGLTVIVHEDRKAPIVAVNVWYHVGSKNERPGRTGFAHLFEHLMFNGSENYDDDWFQALEPLGATDLNGTTNTDRTNYFQNVPTSALDFVLWMESDRMGHLLGAVTQEKLDEQRGVVQNELRQSYENQPYGRVWLMIPPATYPKGHPYSWPTIGSLDDLNAASLEDVHDWFRTYYGAANAVIVLAGDIDAATAREKVEKYFGHIPAGPPIAAHRAWVAPRTGTQREVLQDRVPQARIYKVWNVPEWGSEEAIRLGLAAAILGSGKTSRLYERLVYTDQIASDASAFLWEREIGSQLFITATARPGESLREVERAIDEELARFLVDGPTEQEVRRVKTRHRAGFVRGIERIGGFGGKSDVLAINQVFAGDPSFYRVRNRHVAEAEAPELQAAARRWLSDGVYVLEVHPFAEHSTLPPAADRTRPPEAGTPPPGKFPDFARASLSNGLRVVLAERRSVPQVNLTLLVDAGYAADQLGRPGTARLAMDVLDEGTRSRTALEIAEELAQLGARLTAGANLDLATVTLSALTENLGPSLDLFADVVLNPSFPEAEVERQRKLLLDRIRQEKVNPVQMALRVFPALLYGEGHAYGNPLTGSGTESSVSAITRDDLEEYHRIWFKPNNATLVVVGATTLEEILPELERRFGGWAPGEVPRKNVARVPHREAPAVYLLDRPDAAQSILFAGHVAPPKNNPDEIAIETMNAILGGQFISRVNMNLREGKGWSYGAFTFLWDARGQRPFVAYAPVQTDRTAEAIAELRSELEGIGGPEPITPDELEKAKRSLTLTLPGRWETMAAVAGDLTEIVRFRLPDDHFDRYAERVRGVGAEEVTRVAREVVRPGHMVWVVVGDRAKVEPAIRELGLGEVRLIDADGRVLDESPQAAVP